MRPDSLPRLWRYINLLFTYILTSIDKGILKVGGSDVTKCVFVSSMPEIH